LFGNVIFWNVTKPLFKTQIIGQKAYKTNVMEARCFSQNLRQITSSIRVCHYRKFAELRCHQFWLAKMY